MEKAVANEEEVIVRALERASSAQLYGGPTHTDTQTSSHIQSNHIVLQPENPKSDFEIQSIIRSIREEKRGKVHKGFIVQYSACIEQASRVSLCLAKADRGEAPTYQRDISEGIIQPALTLNYSCNKLEYHSIECIRLIWFISYGV